jgi:hypothetical protein
MEGLKWLHRTMMANQDTDPKKLAQIIRRRLDKIQGKAKIKTKEE